MSGEYDVHPHLIARWKRKARQSLPGLFSEKADRGEAAHDAGSREPHTGIGAAERGTRFSGQIGLIRGRLKLSPERPKTGAASVNNLQAPDGAISWTDNDGIHFVEKRTCAVYGAGIKNHKRVSKTNSKFIDLG